MRNTGSATRMQPASGKLGVMLAGQGAVATTFFAGVHSVLQGRSLPIGSLTQLATIRLGKQTNGRSPRIQDTVPLAKLNDLVFASWDPIADDALVAARKAGVLNAEDLNASAKFLESIVPMPAAFDGRYTPRITGENVKRGANKREIAEQIRADIQEFREVNDLDRVVMIWCASTETWLEEGVSHQSIDSFEKGMYCNEDSISPSMLYAWAAIQEGVPFCNGAANLTVDLPCFLQLADEMAVPISGKDFKTGQTWLKSAIAPAIKARMLGLDGWYSTNILGNRDGEVLDDPSCFRTKEESKRNCLQSILQPDVYPMLYGDFAHVVRINYYPPRGDNKEGWDNIDIVGWMGYPMQIKVNFLCRDSILAAPIVLDLALFSDLAMRAGFRGIQEWLSFYYKSPMAPQGLEPEHDLFVQQAKLKNTLRYLMGEEQITHLGTEYYP